MENIQTYEKFFSNFLRKKSINTKKEKEMEIFVDTTPYDVSQFGQDKYMIYIKSNRKYYYIGDLRRFNGEKRKFSPFTSYIDIDRVKEVDNPVNKISPPSIDQMKIIDRELNKEYLSPNVMDEPMTYKEFLRNKGIT